MTIIFELPRFILGVALAACGLVLSLLAEVALRGAAWCRHISFDELRADMQNGADFDDYDGWF